MNIQVGNAASDTSHNDWFVGHFMEKELGLQHSTDVEIKWGKHPIGDGRAEWGASDFSTTISILISGKFEIEFRDRTVVLAQPGDYVMWPKGCEHKARALEESVVLTVRWPSQVPKA
ncbi:signal peptidase I [Candidatus Saccharibacteria bacterium]|nr:signal peptidase I [Candidatus Saccharibacteria bacterium]